MIQHGHSNSNVQMQQVKQGLMVKNGGGNSNGIQINYSSQGQQNSNANNYQTYMNSFLNENDMNNKQKENQQKKQGHQSQNQLYQSKASTVSLVHDKPHIRIGNKNSTNGAQIKQQLQLGTKDRMQTLVSLDPRTLTNHPITPQPQIHISETFRGNSHTKSQKDLQSPKKNSINSLHEPKKSLSRDPPQQQPYLPMTKSSDNLASVIQNGRNQVNNNHHQILGFYNNNNTHDLQLSPTKDSMRMVLAVDKVKDFMIQTQPNMQQMQVGFIDARSLPLANGTKMKRNGGGKAQQQKSTMNLKLQSSNNQSSTFDSLEGIQTQFKKTYSNTTKHATKRNINISQSTSKLIKNDSQTQIGYAHRSGLYDYSQEMSTSQNHSKNYQARIQKMGVAQKHSQLQSSLSSALLSRDSSGVRNNSSRKLNSSKQSMFRPQSLKQLMPTIDEQIMRLTELSKGNDNQQDYQSTQFLFKTLQQNNQRNQKQNTQVREYQTQPSVRIPVEQTGKILVSDRQDDRNEGQEDKKEAMTLQHIKEKTGLILSQYKQKEKLLLKQCEQQQAEIEYLKERLRQYENVL